MVGPGTANPAPTNLKGESMDVIGYTVKRTIRGTCKMWGTDSDRLPKCQDYEEPHEFFSIFDPAGRLVYGGTTNATIFCCPDPIGTGEGRKATDEQIIYAVLNDESVFDY